MFQYFIFAAIFISVSGDLLSAASKCPPGSVIRHSTKCYKFHSEISSYDVANLSCSILNGYLARVHDKEENDFLTQHSQLYFKDVEPSDAWIERDAKELSKINKTYVNFRVQSVRSSDRYCTSLQSKDGFWEMNHCEKSIRKAYICEYELPMNTVSPKLENSTTTSSKFDVTVPYATTKQSLTATPSKIASDVPVPTITASATNTVPSAITAPKVVSDTTTVPPTTTKQPITTPQQPFTTIPPNLQSNNCSTDWLHFNGFCYQKTPKKYSWQNAENYCATKNAHLVSIHNDEEFNFVDGFDKNRNCYWIGLHSTAKDVKVWEYTDGTIFNFAKFQFPDQKFLDPRLASCVYSCNHHFSNANSCNAEIYAVCKKSAIA